MKFRAKSPALPGWRAVLMDSCPHVYPLEDLREHVLDPECWCRPYDDDGVVVHNSMDRREEYEKGRKPS